MSERVAVIGGGVAGLAAAHRLLELGRDVTLFEASDRVGGAFGTLHVDTPHGRYLVELGADMFITDKPWGVALSERLGLSDELVSVSSQYRRSLVLRDGKPTPVPEGFMLMAPSLIAPMARSTILSWPAKLRMGADLFLPRGPQGADVSVAAFVRRRFGQQALDRLVQPMIGGIYTGDPERLSLRATLPRFLDMESEHRSVILAMIAKRRAGAARAANGDASASGARYGMFVGFRDGMKTLLERLTQRLGERVQLSSPVTAISADNGGYRIAGSTFDAVVVALPAHLAARLIAPLDSGLAALLDEIEYASSAVVLSGHALADCGDPMEAFGLVIPHRERRNILAVSYASRKLPGRAPAGRILLRTFVGGGLQPELATLGDRHIRALVRSELAAIYGITAKPDFMLVARHERAMPQYHVGHLARLERIWQRLSTHPRLALCGNAYHGVGIPDCIHSGELAAERAAVMVPRREATLAGEVRP